jgi:hypothetical protein
VENMNNEFGVNYFKNIDTSSTDDFIYLIKHVTNSPNPSMNTKCTTTEEIEKIIMTLKLKNFSGYDEISTKILKMTAPL